jgi:hypothetical protein
MSDSQIWTGPMTELAIVDAFIAESTKPWEESRSGAFACKQERHRGVFE